MQSFAFEVAVRCPLELVFEIYIDIDRWRNRSIFGEIRWVKGSPWQEGSRLTIEKTTGARMTQRNWSSVLRLASKLGL